MSEDTEIDPEVLRQEVEQIKGAMGLNERYPSEFRYWLVYGVLIALASGGSQLIALYELPNISHSVVWFGLLGAGGIYQWSKSSPTNIQRSSTGTKPRLGLLYPAVFSFIIVVLFVVFPETDSLPDAQREIIVFSQFVGLTGVAYLVVGEVLRAYYIRQRDRWAFYLGGVWMLVLAVLLPNVEFLNTWGYGVFGILYVVHALVSYLALR